MTSQKPICVVTCSRAEYGLLRPVMEGLRDSPRYQLQVIVGGMHLEERFGETWREIEADGFTFEARVPLAMDGGDSLSAAGSLGMAVSGFAEALSRCSPELVVVLGDRFEILGAAQAALLLRIPLAHLCGGDVTSGALDDAMRHSITKMAQLHFPSNEAAGRRIMQLGEDLSRVHVVGSPGLDVLRNLTFLDREALESALDFRFAKRNLLITYHPETLDPEDPVVRLEALLEALDSMGPDFGLLFTMPNADPGGARCMERIAAYTESRPGAKAWTSMGALRYLSAMKYCDAVVGNSSSGLYEAPSLKTPTVNIGSRQEGRPKARSVIDCGPDSTSILRAIEVALDWDTASTVNPFGDGRTAPRILRILNGIEDFGALLTKTFVDRELRS